MENINRALSKFIGITGFILMAYGLFSFTPFVERIGLHNALKPAELFLLGFFLSSYEMSCMLAMYRARFIDKENHRILCSIERTKDGISFNAASAELIGTTFDYCFKSNTRDYCYTFKSASGQYFQVSIKWKMPRFKPASCVTTLIPEPTPANS